MSSLRDRRLVWSLNTGGTMLSRFLPQPFFEHVRLAIASAGLLIACAPLSHAQGPLSPEGRFEAAMTELRSANTEERRFYLLAEAAMTSFEVGDSARAVEYATELLLLAPSYSSNWNYGNAIHKGNLVLGRVALQLGNEERAEELLLLAGKTRGSPQLNSFGPNMTLAKELLAHGRRDSVLAFLDLCASFWVMEDDRLEVWSAQIRGGEEPKFGPNLLY